MIKFLKLTTLPLDYLAEFHSKNSNLETYSYNENLKVLFSDKYGWNDIWKDGLERIGNFEVMEVISNCEKLQRKWATENNKNILDSDWMFSIIEFQIQFFEPEVIFVHGYFILTNEQIKYLRSKYSCIKFFLGYDGIVLNDVVHFSEFDFVLCCMEDSANFYNLHSNKTKGYFFPLAFDSRIVESLKFEEQQIDFTFLGSFVRGEQYHNQRIEDMVKLIHKTNIQIYSSGLNEPYEPFRYLQRNRLMKGEFKEFYQVYKIGKRIQKPLFGKEMFNKMASSKISFNSHGNNAGAKAANMRLFEATGVGSCLLTDYKENLTDFFEIDKEIVTYKTVNECIEKVTFLLKNNELRKSIAKAGQKRTLENHTYRIRIKDFGYYLQSFL